MSLFFFQAQLWREFENQLIAKLDGKMLSRTDNSGQVATKWTWPEKAREENYIRKLVEQEGSYVAWEVLTVGMEGENIQNEDRVEVNLKTIATGKNTFKSISQCAGMILNEITKPFNKTSAG